jgi:hypothetical protein
MNKTIICNLNILIISRRASVYLDLIKELQLMIMKDLESIKENNMSAKILVKMYKTLSDMRDELYMLD